VRAESSATPHFPPNPGLGELPVAHDGVARDAQRFGGLFDAEASEEPHLDDFRLSGVTYGQRLKRVVERDEIR
jgi:hypothetical protein